MLKFSQSKILKSSLDDELNVNICDWPGCENEGMHRAPKSRNELHSYHHFCLTHVRQYNKGWNYYAGMSDSEVELDIRKDTVWNRPSWPLGKSSKPEDIYKKMGVFGPEWGRKEKLKDPPRSYSKLEERENWAIAVFSMTDPPNRKTVKSRYKELVKKHHPDKNRGDKVGEEKIKEINVAYKIILEMLGC
ncbi:MAG: DnaJ domain-containing protein [Pseudomonadota bacterium]|nr:DnaJ domain-containing protein [Pseudomonadota bacterium]